MVVVRPETFLLPLTLQVPPQQRQQQQLLPLQDAAWRSHSWCFQDQRVC